MFKTNQSFSSYSVDDIDAARDFYTDKLGLKAEKTDRGTLDLKLAGGQTVMLYPEFKANAQKIADATRTPRGQAAQRTTKTQAG